MKLKKKFSFIKYVGTLQCPTIEKINKKLTKWRRLEKILFYSKFCSFWLAKIQFFLRLKLGSSLHGELYIKHAGKV